MAKKIGKGIGIAFLVLAAVIVLVLGYFTIREYRPAAVEPLEVSDGNEVLKEGDSLSVLTYNIGYGGLSQDEDFFMDGGTKVRPETKELIFQNLKGITELVQQQDPDIVFFQEVDQNSSRSYHIDEIVFLEEQLSGKAMFARNFLCDFVPYPLPPLGKMDSGLVMMTDYSVTSASRIALPESFSWPVKTCNLKRCMLESRISVDGTDKELVIINFHLEAYDSGEGKIAQSRMLSKKLEEEYAKGNYVIAGGDFNQSFEGCEAYPLLDSELWTPGIISDEDIPEHFSLVNSQEYPTCRLLNAPYTGDYETSQVYVIDGYIVSDNLQVDTIQVINTDFMYSDHQPVRLDVTLR